MRFTKEMTVGPTFEPISLQHAKDELKITSSPSEDALNLDRIARAREWVEDEMGLRFVPQTWEYYLDYFPAVIRLYDISPLQSVTSIQYIDTDGVTQTLDASLYTVDAKKKPGEIHPAWGKTWPSTRSDPNAVTVTAVVGYTTLAKIPKMLTGYMLALISEMEVHRSPIITGTIVQRVPLHVIAAAQAYKVSRFA